MMDQEPELGPEPLDPPTREEEEAEAWEYWHQRAHAAEAKAHELLDLAHNVGGFDDGLLTSADLNLIRATLREFRDQARAAIAKATGAPDA